MEKPDFQRIIRELTDGQTPRVWSLLVTVFGELAQEQGVRISSPVLGRLTALMGLRPEAVRVALHRLRKDGWIESLRQGRTSSYALTDWGREQSALASPRIYGLTPTPEQVWMVVYDPARTQPDTAQDEVFVMSNLLVTSAPDAAAMALRLPLRDTDPVPDWITAKICKPEVVEAAQAFHTGLVRMQNSLQHFDIEDIFEISALRIHIVHGWRRIILRAPNLPAHVFPEGWCGAACQDRVVTLLSRFARQDLTDLDEALAIGSKALDLSGPHP